jgi:chemotaxis protein histidine kinase CheA
MTASPPLNGHKRPAMPVLGDWQAVTSEPVEEQSIPQPEPTVDAEVARARAWAEAEERRVAAEAEKEERRIKAEAEADAIRVRAEEDARKARLANDRQERKDREAAAASDARIAESNLKREEAERARVAAAAQAEIDEQVEARKVEGVEKANKKWRRWAIGFYALCAAVALPVQISAFWNPSKPWMAGAPVLLEIAALVVAFGTAAAVANQRPHWHFRLITWVLAFIAAGVNFGHGITEFDLATAIGTGLASVFGPGVWDLHEHGRLRRRDGVPTRRERNAAKAEAKRVAEKQAAEELFTAEREAHREKAQREQLEKLAADRADRFPDVWDHALTLAAALGETTVTDAVWRRAHKDVKGTDPGDSPEAQNLRNAAARRMLDARADAPEKSVWKIQDAQVNPQVPPTRRRGSVTGPPVRGTRRAGDTPKFVDAARKQAAITAKSAATDTRPSDN